MAGIRIRGKSAPGPSAAEGTNTRRATAGLLGLRYPWWRIVAGLVVLAVVAVFAASLGSVHVPFFSVVEITVARLPGVELSPDIPAAWDTILWKLRLPRVAQAAVVGAALAMSGAAYQGLFQEPAGRPLPGGSGVRRRAGRGGGLPHRHSDVLGRDQPPAHRGLCRRNRCGGGGLRHRPQLAWHTDDHADSGRGRHRLAGRGRFQPADNAERP